MSKHKPITLNEYSLRRGVKWLVTQDADLAAIYHRFGHPPLWAREAGFATLVHIILEQQVSLASARAAFNRLRQRLIHVEPQGLLTLDDDELKVIGFSRQKTCYSRLLAEAVITKQLDLAAMATQADDEIRATLTQLKGIGDWTVDVYLLMALGRPDIWPIGDLALAVALQRAKRLPTRPSPAEMTALAESWRPWRAVAARLLWHLYLSERKS